MRPANYRRARHRAALATRPRRLNKKARHVIRRAVFDRRPIEERADPAGEQPAPSLGISHGDRLPDEPKCIYAGFTLGHTQYRARSFFSAFFCPARALIEQCVVHLSRLGPRDAEWEENSQTLGKSVLATLVSLSDLLAASRRRASQSY